MMSYIKAKCSSFVDCSVELIACRVCLTTGVKLLDLHTNRLSGAFQEITNIPLSPGDGLPHHICSICSYFLNKAVTFRSRSHDANTLLNKARDQHLLTTDYLNNVDRTSFKPNLTTHTLNPIDYTPDEIEIVDNFQENNFMHVEYIKEETDRKIEENKIVEDIIGDGDAKLVHDSLNKENDDGLPNDVKKESSDPEFDFDCGDNDSSDYIVEIDINKRTKKNANSKKVKKKVKGEKNGKKSKKPVKKLSKKIKKESNDSESDREFEDLMCKVKDIIEIKDREEKQKPKREIKVVQSKNLKSLMDFAKSVNFSISFFSKEEQIQEVMARKESENYKSGRFKCHECYKGFMQESAFNNHKKVHDPSAGSHLCELCRIWFPTVTYLNKHLLKHRVNFVCKECNQTCKTNFQAKQHYKFHSGVLYQCKFCSKTFCQSSTYHNHVRIHHGSAVCDLCGASFVGRAGLQAHVARSHRDAALARCAQCNTQFHSAEACQRHTERGAGRCQTHLRPCATCGESFPSEESLNSHYASHTEPIYKCEVCHKTYRNEKYLSMHWQNVHKEGKRQRTIAGGGERDDKYVCEVCGKGFKVVTFLKYHQRLHTGEKPIQCRICPKRFRLPVSLTAHMKTHTNERPYQCPHCPKAFKTVTHRITHMLTHTKEKPHECGICHKRFSLVGNLTEHVNTVHMGLPRRRRNK